MLNQFLDSLKLSLSAGIEYRILSVCVNVIHVTPVLYQILDKLDLAFSASIVEGSLAKSVDLPRIDSQIF
jgi:hypothetical protein